MKTTISFKSDLNNAAVVNAFIDLETAYYRSSQIDHCISQSNQIVDFIIVKYPQDKGYLYK